MQILRTGQQASWWKLETGHNYFRGGHGSFGVNSKIEIASMNRLHGQFAGIQSQGRFSISQERKKLLFFGRDSNSTSYYPPITNSLRWCYTILVAVKCHAQPAMH